MRRLCRKRVLEALADTPAACGEDLTPAQWLSCYAANLCNFVFICLFLKLSGRFCFEILHWSVQETMWYTTAGIFTITIGLFVYFTYVVDIIDRMRIGSKGSRNGSEKTD
jgi:hypothetical protein